MYNCYGKSWSDAEHQRFWHDKTLILLWLQCKRLVWTFPQVSRAWFAWVWLCLFISFLDYLTLTLVPLLGQWALHDRWGAFTTGGSQGVGATGADAPEKGGTRDQQNHQRAAGEGEAVSEQQMTFVRVQYMQQCLRGGILLVNKDKERYSHVKVDVLWTTIFGNK